ncbi:MAG: ATP-grasp domain-containing protein, partial [Actinomycetes bacterium]
MDLYEYQAKELFALNQISTQVGKVVTNAEDAKKAAQEFNKPVVVKAQVKTGGRGKAGGVKLAN